MIKLSSLCHDKAAVEFHGQTAHLKEPLCTIFFRISPEPKPKRNPITYGYVKDMRERLSFKRSTRALMPPVTASRRPHVPSSNLQCQRADKNNPTRKQPLFREAPRQIVLRLQRLDPEALRCGDTPLSSTPIRVKSLLHFYDETR